MTPKATMNAVYSQTSKVSWLGYSLGGEWSFPLTAVLVATGLELPLLVLGFCALVFQVVLGKYHMILCR